MVYTGYRMAMVRSVVLIIILVGDKCVKTNAPKCDNICTTYGLKCSLPKRKTRIIIATLDCKEVTRNITTSLIQ